MASAAPAIDAAGLLRWAPAAEEVAACSGLVQLTPEGPGRSFVNPHCWVFHVVTLDHVACQLEGEATAEDTWWPGYAWTCAHCSCGQHLGWHFRGEEAAQPREFFALRTSASALLC